MSLHLSPDGLAFLRKEEGVRAHAYRDSAGYWTIGVGHRLTRDELSSGKLVAPTGVIRWRDGLTPTQIDALLDDDLVAMTPGVSFAVSQGIAGQPPQPHHVDALFALAFNIGPSAFAMSTLVKKLRAGEVAAVPKEWRRWVYSGGVVSPGLRGRREREIALWEGRSA